MTRSFVHPKARRAPDDALTLLELNETELQCYCLFTPDGISDRSRLTVCRTSVR